MLRQVHERPGARSVPAVSPAIVRSISGHLAQAIKTARELILLPYTQRTVTERPGGRGGGRDRGERGERGERAERTLSDTIGADAPRDRDASVEILSDVEDFDRTTSNGYSDVAVARSRRSNPRTRRATEPSTSSSASEDGDR